MDQDIDMRPKLKYDEENILREINDYIINTYGSHYDSEDGIQVMDLMFSDGDATPFCKWNGIKYLARYGKKDGFNRNDLLKTIHYCFFLMYENGRKHSQ